MTKKILLVAIIAAMFLVVIPVTKIVPIYALDISADDIKEAQRQANEAADKAKDIAAQANLQLSQTNSQIQQATSQTNQAAVQTKLVTDDNSKIANNQTLSKTSVISNCETITKSIDAQITKFSDGKNPRIEKFQIIANNTTELIKKMKDEKIDTKGLETSLAVLDKKIKNYVSVQDLYISNITTTKSSACQKSENEFKSNLLDSQNSLKTAKERAKDLQDYVQKTLRLEIQKIRDQIKN
jgi:F0F1-type ATP synthase membrane subunit b/b'